MKKVYRWLCIALGVIIIACLAIVIKTNKFSSNIRFKNEYEALNGVVNEHSKIIRSVNIDKDNPFKYISAEKLVKKIENKESFYVYFGFAKCPWCRSVLPTLIQVAKELDVKRIYYVDVLDIRDTLKIDDNGNITSEKMGTKAYYSLIALMDNVLDDYTIKDKDGNEVKTGEKRIYAPNVVKVEKGIATLLTTGISDKQTDAYMELDKDMIKDTYNKFYELMK